MGKHLVAENCVSDLRSVHEVHLKKSGLEMALFGLVVLEGIEEEGSGGLYHILGHEDIDDLKGTKYTCVNKTLC